MVESVPGEAKEPSQGVFFRLWKLVKALVEKIENLKTSPQRLIIRMGANERYERGIQPRSVRRSQVWSESQDFVSRGNPPG